MESSKGYRGQMRRAGDIFIYGIFFLIELELINNIVLVSGVQQSDSGIYVNWNS